MEKKLTRWKEKEVDTSKLITGEETTAEYYNGKLPLRIYAGQEIIYTLRVYNEGQIDGYVTEIVDYLPEQLEFLPDDEFNTSRGWSYVEGDDTLSKIKTNYLSKDVDENKNLIKAFNAETGEIDYVEVAVKCKVKPNAVAKQLITNIAEITKYEAKDRPDAVDRDSEKFADIPEESDKPSYKQDEIEKDYVPGQEDDDDFEKVIVEEFDLALRKFITEVNGKDINSRIPEFKINSEGQYVYEHDKTPVEVAHNNLVEYTIRVYNEGTVDGYANLVKDDIPEGLVFVRNNEINKQYKWKLLDANGNETKDILLAEYIVTDYLSKENGEKPLDNSDDVSDVNNKDISDKDNVNLIKAFDSSVMDEPDYRDLKVVFEVNVPNRTDDIIINEAQISDDTDEFGEEVDDKDSTTDEWIEGEDDQDREYLKLVYFDLALKKWVSHAYVTENGKDRVIETGHTGDENPEPVVKVDMDKKQVDKVKVKFKYQIKVTNEGVVPGYVKEISDYIPEGLRFEQSDNPTWSVVDGKVVTSQAKDVLLQPGDSVQVSIILTWINSADNLGLKVNTAEISEDYNDYGDTPDVDSTPNNKVDGEDDIDTAPVILSVRTGEVRVYVAITISVLSIISLGVVLIKRFFYNS